ncbi:MAG: hypothetical protein ACE5KA_06580 [Nitrososphaerales archaeon]
MSFDKLCDEVMMMSKHVLAAFVEHKEGCRLSERIKKVPIEIEADKILLGLLRGAQLVELTKDFRKEVGNIQVIIHMFDKLTSFLFPLKDNHTLIVAVEPVTLEFSSFIKDVKESIRKNRLHMSIIEGQLACSDPQ